MHELEASSGATQVQAAELAGLRDRVTTLTAQLKVCHPCDWREMTSIKWSRPCLNCSGLMSSEVLPSARWKFPQYSTQGDK